MCTHNDDWPWGYETPIGPASSTPRRIVTKSKGKRSARLSSGSKPSGKQTYLSTYRQRMAMANQKPSTFRRKSNSASTATTTNTNSSKSHRRDSSMAVSTRKSPVKSAATKSAGTKQTNKPAKASSRRRTSSKTTVKQGVILPLHRAPAGKGGYFFSNLEDGMAKLDATNVYVSQRDMKKTGSFELALAKEPVGKGGVKFANTAKEKLDITNMYLSQKDRKTLGVTDSVTVKVTEDDNGWFVTVTP